MEIGASVVVGCWFVCGVLSSLIGKAECRSVGGRGFLNAMWVIVGEG